MITDKQIEDISVEIHKLLFTNSQQLQELSVKR